MPTLNMMAQKHRNNEQRFMIRLHFSFFSYLQELKIIILDTQVLMSSAFSTAEEPEIMIHDKIMIQSTFFEECVGGEKLRIHCTILWFFFEFSTHHRVIAFNSHQAFCFLYQSIIESIVCIFRQIFIKSSPFLFKKNNNYHVCCYIS